MLNSHWGSKATCAFLMVVAICSLLGGSGILVAYSCLMAAFARDGGLPYRKLLTIVHPKINMPINCIFVMVVGCIFILLFSLSDMAKEIIYSLAVIATFVNLAIPTFLRLLAGDRWVPGPWNLGRWSKPVFACAFATEVYMIIIECFPTVQNVTGSTLNYDWVVLLGVFLISGISFLITGERYEGLDLAAIARARGNYGSQQ